MDITYKKCKRNPEFKLKISDLRTDFEYRLHNSNLKFQTPNLLNTSLTPPTESSQLTSSATLQTKCRHAKNFHVTSQSTYIQMSIMFGWGTVFKISQRYGNIPKFKTSVGPKNIR